MSEEQNKQKYALIDLQGSYALELVIDDFRNELEKTIELMTEPTIREMVWSMSKMISANLDNGKIKTSWNLKKILIQAIERREYRLCDQELHDRFQAGLKAEEDLACARSHARYALDLIKKMRIEGIGEDINNMHKALNLIAGEE